MRPDKQFDQPNHQSSANRYHNKMVLQMQVLRHLMFPHFIIKAYQPCKAGYEYCVEEVIVPTGPSFHKGQFKIKSSSGNDQHPQQSYTKGADNFAEVMLHLRFHSRVHNKKFDKEFSRLAPLNPAT